MSRGKRALTLGTGVLAGLGLFLLLESAIARRVGLDLFLPAAEGAFLPGRLTRLVIVLALTVLAALRGQKLFAWLDRVCDKDRGRWALSAAVTALFFAWAARVTVLSYLITDDIINIRAIAAIPTQGYDLAARTFSSDLFCAILGLFYRLDPDGYWYFYYEIAMQLLALVILGRCVLLLARRRGWPALAGCLIHAALCAGLFLYPFAAITFTITAAMAGTAAAALVLCRDAIGTRAGRIASDIAGGLLMVLCYLQRSASGRALLCFWALAMAYQLVKTLLARDGRWKGRALALCAAAAVTVGAMFLCGRVSLAQLEPEYWPAESTRSRIVDYLIDELEPEHFQAAGFTPELSNLLRDWFFMDEHVTAESFSALAQAYYESGSAGGASGSRLAGLISSLAAHIASDGQMSVSSLAVLALLALALGVFWRTGKGAWLSCLTAACAAGGGLIMSLYLLAKGYFPARAFLVIAYPAAVTMVLALLATPRSPEALPHARRTGSGCVMGLAGAALAVLCVLGVVRTPHTTEAATRADLFSGQWRMEAYANEHPDVTIINNAYYAVLDPLHSGSYPQNLIWWGNCGDLSKAPEDRLYAGAFFREDVQFLGNGFSTLMYLLQYLTEEYGPVQASMVTQLSRDLYVTDIDLVTPGPGYTGWYEQNGMTYYFENGAALTGEHVIDGESYTFGPAGSGSQLATAQGDGLIYTTDAYSLVS